jgi:hypothetical protein
MRRSLHLALAASVLLSAWAVWWPDAPQPGPSGRVVEAAVRQGTAAESDTRQTSAPSVPPPVEGYRNVRTTMLNALLEPAVSDPFARLVAQPMARTAVPAPPPQLLVATVPPPEPMPIPPPPPPAPPPVRYLGMVLSPSGERLLLLAQGDQVLSVSPGLTLPGGYVVQSREPEGLRLVHSASGASHLVAIPSAADAGP